MIFFLKKKMSYSFHNPKLPQNVDNFNPVDNFKTLFKEYPREFAKTFPVMTKHFKSQPWSGMIPRGKKAKIEEQRSKLGHLPNEILAEISAFFQDPQDFLNFSLISRDFMLDLINIPGRPLKSFLFSNVSVTCFEFVDEFGDEGINDILEMELHRPYASNMLFDYMKMAGAPTMEPQYLKHIHRLLLNARGKQIDNSNLYSLNANEFEIKRVPLYNDNMEEESSKPIKFHLKHFPNLKRLRLENCKIETIDNPKLTDLQLVYCHNFHRIPKEAFPNLKRLLLQECSMVRTLPSLPKLTHLGLLQCNGLSGLPPSLPELTHLKMSQCHRIKEIPTLPNVTHLVFAHRGYNFRTISKDYINLISLTVQNCPFFIEIPFFNKLIKLNLRGVNVTKITKYPKLIDLTVDKCPKLTEIAAPNMITHLKVIDCPMLREIFNFKKLIHLKLSFAYCSLKNLPRLSTLLLLHSFVVPAIPSLTHLKVYYFDYESVWGRGFKHGLSSYPKLTRLKLGHCNLTETQFKTLARTYPALTFMSLVSCNFFTGLPTYPKLTHLVLERCHNLEKITSLPMLKELKVLGARSLRKISKLPALRNLVVKKCIRLKEVEFLPMLEELEILGGSVLKVSNLHSLKKLKIRRKGVIILLDLPKLAYLDVTTGHMPRGQIPKNTEIVGSEPKVKPRERKLTESNQRTSFDFT